VIVISDQSSLNHLPFHLIGLDDDGAAYIPDQIAGLNNLVSQALSGVDVDFPASAGIRECVA
jgi:hypothetical protein